MAAIGGDLSAVRNNEVKRRCELISWLFWFIVIVVSVVLVAADDDGVDDSAAAA